MRQPAGAAALEAFMAAVGAQATGPGSIYFVGGASAILMAWRSSTIDIDIALAPEPAGLFGALEDIKRRLDVNVELAAPDQFVPPLPGWQGRSVFIKRLGRVDFYHYDFYSQAFAKLSRGHARDLLDVASMLRAGEVQAAALLSLVEQVASEMARFPNLNAAALLARIRAWAAEPSRGIAL